MSTIFLCYKTKSLNAESDGVKLELNNYKDGLMRKKLVTTLLLISLLAALLPTAASGIWHEEIPFASSAKTAYDEVEFRVLPFVDAEIIDVFDEDEKIDAVFDLTASEYSGVRIGDKRGFILSAALYDYDKEDPDDPTEAWEYEYQYYMNGYDGYVNSDYVRLRSEPDYDSEILGELGKYTPVVIMTDTAQDWIGVIANGAFGYVFNPYVSFVSPECQAEYQRGVAIAAEALKYEGVPYAWGGTSPDTGFDCSGFIWYVFTRLGYNVPRLAGALEESGRLVTADMQPGDILCFACDEELDTSGAVYNDFEAVPDAIEEIFGEGCVVTECSEAPIDDNSTAEAAPVEENPIESTNAVFETVQQDIGDINHVGIYLGNGRFIRATHSQGCIRISTIKEFNEAVGYEVPFTVRRIV